MDINKAFHGHMDTLYPILTAAILVVDRAANVQRLQNYAVHTHPQAQATTADPPCERARMHEGLPAAHVTHHHMLTAWILMGKCQWILLGNSNIVNADSSLRLPKQP